MQRYVNIDMEMHLCRFSFDDSEKQVTSVFSFSGFVVLRNKASQSPRTLLSSMIRTPRCSVPSVDEPIYMAHRSQSRLRMHSSNRRSHSGVSYSLCVSHSSRSDPNLCRSQLFTALSIVRPSFHPKSSPRSNNRKVIGRTRTLSHARDRSKAHISSNGTDALPSST